MANAPVPSSLGSSDRSVQATNDDATVSKLSCVKAGYFGDPFVSYFVRRPVKRSPVINRGYYARWAAHQVLLQQFLRPSADPTDRKKRQIISLGAGFDTLFFQLKEQGITVDRYVEIDFQEVISKKSSIISATESLKKHLAEDTVFTDKGEILSSSYCLLSADLRNTQLLETALVQKCAIDCSAATLVLAECVLIYMDSQSSRRVVQWLASSFPSSSFVIYEQIHPHDAFGQQMIRNLESRGCPLLGIFDTPTLEAKKLRFTELGFKRADAVDMDDIYRKHLNPDDVRRIETLEIFDEFEEWHIMQEHYCIAYGINDATDEGTWKSFGFTPGQ
eukprot:TRINITY_DN13951_c0_g1_i2.p1 TRINITY_DN13951_c0_g1~~TRINITY_DN13951_c0_g1_i2.p1  ORF type:complete len:344 (+),score=69.09 TRINITY_DN13951_c0_g1_i2:36-1034(+)